tara:strand:- start:382 stop:519 length:138 start_codon:yes stop_codon:yes gene_type:complete
LCGIVRINRASQDQDGTLKLFEIASIVFILCHEFAKIEFISIDDV